MDNKKRKNRVTSSQASRIIQTSYKGKKNERPSSAFFTYCKELVLEKELNRSINTEVKTKAIKWGSLMECKVFEMLPLGFTMTHKQTIEHYKYGDFWSGTPDVLSKPKRTHGEIKCFWLEKFAKLALVMKTQKIELLKADFPEEYWQCVSNGCITKSKYAHLFLYMPTKKELEKIITDISETDFLQRNNLEPKDYYFMTHENIETLPYLPEDSNFPMLNDFRFEIPKEDKVFLTKRVLMAKEECKKIAKEYDVQF